VEERRGEEDLLFHRRKRYFIMPRIGGAID
jgi:hypothetical protein